MEDNPNLTKGKDTKESSYDGDGTEALEEDGETGPPTAGMSFSSEEEVRDYYSKYAQNMGFGIYRRSSRCGEDGKVKYFTLACANAGKVRPTNNTNSGATKRPSAKTNCKAKINVAVESDVRVYVCHVVLEHNHELSPGKVQQSIRKKVWSPRVPRKRERQAKTGVRSCQFPVLESLSSDSTADGVSYSHQSGNGYSNHSPYNGVGPSKSENVLHNLNKIPSPGVFQDFQDALSCALAKKAVGLVKSGMVIGVGSGSTLSLVVGELGKLMKEGKLKDVVVVGTNYHTRRVARQFGVATVDLNDVSGIDIAFDIVDEVDFNKNVLQAGAANHTVQKVVYSIADMCIILADHSKVVHRLGSKFPVAVEVLPIAVTPVLRRLIALGGVPEVRSASGKDGPVISDFGNMIIDARFPNGIQNPAELEKNINLISGVVDNGIVSGVATTVMVAVRNDNEIDIVNMEELVRDMVIRRYTYSIP